MEKNNPEVELQILGNCIKSKETFIKVLNKGITDKDFYTTNNQKIFNSLIECYSNKNSTDVITFYSILERNKVPVSYALEVYTGSIEYTDITPYLNELLELRVNREMIQISIDIKRGTLDKPEDIKKRMNDIDFIKSKIGDDNAIVTLDQVDIVDVYSLEKIPTGFKDIDKRILGFAMGSLNVITGYNGNGKSTLINQMCITESLSRGYKVFAYSPELTNSNLKSWLYPTIAIKDHFVEKEYYGEKYKTLGKLGIEYIDKWIKNKMFIYSDDSITTDEERLLNDMDRLASQGVRVFVIDNLMKIDLKDSYKNENIAQKTFVNKLKNFARKYNALVHLVAHPKKPQLGNSKITKFDISGSGDITNLADYVMSITRLTDDDREDNELLFDKDAVIKVMKDRIKGTGEFAVAKKFDTARKRFYADNYEHDKDYGYTKNIDLVEVEPKTFL